VCVSDRDNARAARADSTGDELGLFVIRTDPFGGALSRIARFPQ